MIYAPQIRAARGLLDMSQTELAKLAGVSPSTMKRIESGASAYGSTLESIQRALERRGVEFIEENGGGPGVRLRKRRR